ncbi:MAG: hypothetical protein M1826_001291 [Phylliscum demangeonii]|nr:MAG: hypothetical protein M1826_001291 [Phylliscum demangeonii]
MTHQARDQTKAAAPSPSSPPPPSHPQHHGPSGLVIFLIIVIIFLILCAVALFAFRHLQARRLGLPTSYNPFRTTAGASRSTSSSPSSSGPWGWVKAQLHRLTNGRQRTAGGAYEEPLGGVGGIGGGRRSTRGFGPLDPDEAWDSRVGNEADTYGPGGYYEEQELGLHSGGPDPEPYGGSEYGGARAHLSTAAPPAYDGEPAASRGRSRERDPSPLVGPGRHDRYPPDHDQTRLENPFDDAGAERSQLGGGGGGGALRTLDPMPADVAAGHHPAAGPGGTDASTR